LFEGKQQAHQTGKGQKVSFRKASELYRQQVENDSAMKT
jgi:hypothetical protein